MEVEGGQSVPHDSHVAGIFNYYFWVRLFQGQIAQILGNDIAAKLIDHGIRKILNGNEIWRRHRAFIEQLEPLLHGAIIGRGCSVVRGLKGNWENVVGEKLSQARIKPMDYFLFGISRDGPVFDPIPELVIVAGRALVLMTPAMHHRRPSAADHVMDRSDDLGAVGQSQLHVGPRVAVERDGRYLEWYVALAQGIGRISEVAWLGFRADIFDAHQCL